MSPKPPASASPSALSRYLGCEYHTYLDILDRRGELGAERKPVQMQMLFDKGNRHEADVVTRMRDDGTEVFSFDDDPTFKAASRSEQAARTIAAMEAGHEVIHQGCFSHDGWVGYPDFLIRIDDAPSDLGPFSYEVADAKLSRTPRPKYVFQLLFYDEQLRRIQGRPPARMSLILGDLTEPEYRSADFQAYADDIRAAFEERLAVLQQGAPSPAPAYPYRVPDCDFCDWWQYCDGKRRADDHLSLVANLSRSQGLKLEGHGVHTLEALVQLPEGAIVPRLAAAAADTLRAQARLQFEARQRPTEPPPFELLEPLADTGLARLPTPSPGDVHFDFEGDPNWGEDGLQYLFGSVCENEDEPGGDPVYWPIWATSLAAEKEAFETWMDWITARLLRYPDLHVFHYNAYETVALKKLVTRHSTRELELDELLKRKVFVDLFGITRQAVRAGVEGYGLKPMEAVFGFERNAELKGAIGSLRRWQKYLDSEGTDQSQLDEIALYNQDDCLSTRTLYPWLMARRPEAEAQWGVVIDTLAPRPAEPPKGKTAEHIASAEALRGALTDGLPDDPALDTAQERAQRLTFDLLGYHRRDAKPAWWEFFARRDMSPGQLRHESGDGIGELTVIDGPEPVTAKTQRWTLAFPPQEHKLGEGDVDDCDIEGGGTILSLDEDAGTLVYKRGTAKGAVAPTRLAPKGPIKTDPLVESLLRFGSRVAEHGLEPLGELDAGTDLLLARAPRFRAGTPPLADEPVDLERLRAQVRGLDGSALVIQGPPGAGKTYTGARLATDLLKRGLRVGVTATSHKAINNLLAAIDAAADEEGVAFRGWKKGTDDDQRYSSDRVDFGPKRPSEDDADGGPVTLVGGTAWHWSAPAQASSVDVLLIDEAGQVSLADAIAVSQAAASVVLLGDPQQLAHVSQGTHLHGSGASVLEHLLGDHQTIPADRGVFLGTSWRMHPDVCAFISGTMYDGRLGSVDGCSVNRVDSPGLSGSGLRMLGCEHDDNRGRAPEEAQLIADQVAAMLDGGTFVSREHPTPQPLTLDDILIVAPYNAQVRCLKAHLPEGARVGTVDKFQGQEAPVVFFSMTASSGDDVTRGMSFLFSRNRLNVAVSRAQALAVVVCSPRLMTAKCATVEDMKLVNMLCRFADAAAD